MHWGANSGSVYSPEGNVGFKCHTEITENQNTVLISGLNVWQTIGAWFLLLLCFGSQIPRGMHLQGLVGSQIMPLKLRCILASCWYQLLGKVPCFHKGRCKPSIFHRPFGLLLLLMWFCFPFCQTTEEVDPTSPQPCHLGPPLSYWQQVLQHHFRNQVLLPQGYKLHDLTLCKRATSVAESASRKANDRKWTQALMLCILSISCCKDLPCSSIK